MIAHRVSHRYLHMTAVGVLWYAARAGAELKPVDLMAFYVAPDQPSTLAWTIAPADMNKLTFELTDFTGRSIRTGEEAQTRGGKVPVQLPQGYYEIAFPQMNQRFGICSVPLREGPRDPFFCMDSALSWLEHRDDVREGVAWALFRLGVHTSRERLRWHAVQPAEKKWEWETQDRYDTLRSTYALAGVGVLEMVHDAPAWMGATRANPFPADLVAAAKSWRDIRERWHPTWTALEIWNEPDIFFGGNLPADQYVPLVKAVAYGLREAKPPTVLAGGVFTHICPGIYRQSSALNGLLDHVDVVSFHTYAHAQDMEAMVATYRAWLKAFGKESMPLWITESGRPWKKGPPRPPLAEDAASALDITMKMIEARACGVAAYYPFISVYFEENDNNFGMMGKEVTPLRSMAAYGQAINALSHKPYRGDWPVNSSDVKRARVFGDDRQSVLVLFTGKIAAGAAVKLDTPITRLEGIDGRKLVRTEQGLVPVPDGLTYVWLDTAAIKHELLTDTPAARLYAISKKPPPSRPEPDSIILQHRFDAQRASASPEGYSLTPEQAAGFALRVRAHNLSDRERKLDLVLKGGPEGAGITAESRPVRVPALGVADVAWELDLRASFPRTGRATLRVDAKDEQGEAVDSLVIHVGRERQQPATQP